VSVAAEISWAIVQQELEAVRAAGEGFGWVVSEQPNRLTFTILMASAVDHERYLFEFECSSYKEIPPYIELIHPETGERGTQGAYPKNGRSFFHTAPAICAPFNRKAYAGYAGIHQEWQIGNWMQLREGVSTLGDMLLLLQSLINNPAVYHGRMA
jgi:hypothetical protein